MICALIAAAGAGTRTGLKENKIFLNIDGVPMIKKTVDVFLTHPLIDKVLVVHSQKDEMRLKEVLGDSVLYAAGGNNRGESVLNGLRALEGNFEKVLVHDGARPFVTEEIITNVINGIADGIGAVAGVRVTDTIKQTDGSKNIVNTPNRATLYAAQTPQGFMLAELTEAYEMKGTEYTDDAAVFEAFGKKTVMVEGGYANRKITTKEDIKMAPIFLSGMGYDVHRLTENRKLILGGVEVPHALGLEGHSDADVLVHAIMDALLGAAGLGDIGKHFPDTDQSFKGISSMLLLKKVFDLLSEHGFKIVNVSAVVMAQKPKLAPFIETMNKNIAGALEIGVQRVNVAATTTEKLGFCGREEGIAAQATVMLEKVF